MPFRLVQMSKDGTKILLPRKFNSVEEAEREARNLEKLFPDKKFLVEEYDIQTYTRRLKVRPDAAHSREDSP